MELISIATWLGSKIAGNSFETVYKKIVSSDDLDKKFKKAISKVSNELQEKYPEILGGDIEYFFKNGEVFNELVKLLFRKSVIDDTKLDEIFDSSTLPVDFIKDFISNLKIELLKEKEFDKILSDNDLFDSIQDIKKDVKRIADNSDVSAKDIKQIKETFIDSLGHPFDLKEFVKLYQKNALNILSQVNFIGLGIDISIKKNRKNLQDIFVKPNFQPLYDTYEEETYEEVVEEETYEEDYYDVIEEDSKYTYKDVINLKDNLVILGNPGSGKSILIKSMICDIISNDSEIDDSNQDYLPIRIELRKYLSYKKENGGNILKYIKSLLIDEYQIHNITEVIFNKILDEQKSLIFFDGLDEVFDIKDKIDIKNDIENIHNKYKKLRSITTSRLIGYDEASLNKEKFRGFIIENFEDEQIVEYVNKWYNQEEVSKEIRNKEIKGFLSKKDEIDFELISNPLLLSLIVILYRNTLRLPESKLEIYQSCTKTLVNKWDASKDLKIDLDPFINSNKDKLFAELAYWQYTQLSSKSIKITYDKAKSIIKIALIEKLNFPDDSNTEDLAEKFMVYAQKRSLYFDNNFTHKTFLEYYTAYWIYSNIEKKHKVMERNQIIEKYINNPFWFIVLELLLNLIDKDQADNEIIDELLDFQLKSSNISISFVLSVLPNLKNISDNKINELLKASIETLLLNKNKIEESKLNNYTYKLETFENRIYFKLHHLYTKENSLYKSKILEILKNYEENNFNVINLYIFYIEIGLFEFPYLWANHHLLSNQLIPIKEIKFELNNISLFESCSKKDPYLYNLKLFVFEQHNINKDYFELTLQFIELFGVEKLFIKMHSPYNEHTINEFINYYISRQIIPENLPSITENMVSLEKIGLTKEKIINYISTKGRFNVREETIIGIINCLEKEEDNQIIIILMIILCLPYRYRYFQMRGNLNLKDLVKNHRFENEILDITSEISFKQKITKILKIFA